MASAQGNHIINHAPVQGENQSECQLRHGDRIFTRTIRNIDSASRCSGHVNRVIAGARAHYQFKRARGQHGLSDSRAAHDQHVRLLLRDCLHECVVFEIGLKENIAAQRLQPIAAGLFELVGY